MGDYSVEEEGGEEGERKRQKEDKAKIEAIVTTEAICMIYSLLSADPLLVFLISLLDTIDDSQ